ncbi:unnamed protein product [Gadus morhua 'NCC']
MTAKSVDDMEPGEGWSSAIAAVAGSSRREVHQDLHRVGQPTQALVLGDQLGGTDGFLGEERKRFHCIHRFNRGGRCCTAFVNCARYRTGGRTKSTTTAEAAGSARAWAVDRNGGACLLCFMTADGGAAACCSRGGNGRVSAKGDKKNLQSVRKPSRKAETKSITWRISLPLIARRSGSLRIR